MCFYSSVQFGVFQKQTLRKDLHVCGEGKDADGQNTTRQLTRIQVVISLGTAGGRAEHASELTRQGRKELGIYPASPALKAVLAGTAYPCTYPSSWGILRQRDRPSH